MNTSNYRVIVFDLGNVLIPFDYRIILNSLNNIEAGLGDNFSKKYYENFHYHDELEKNVISQKTFVDTMLSWLDNKVSAENFCRIYSDLFTVNEKMVQLLPKLKEKYKLVLMSNTNIIHQKYGWGKYEFINHFDKLILSHEVGVAKPDTRIYRAVENFTNEPSNTHFYTDDITEYVNVAKTIGWDGLVFSNYDSFLSELKLKSIL